MKHIPAIAGRELRSLFTSPVAYAVMAVFATLCGFFFLSFVLQFDDLVARYQAFGMQEQLEALNLNDWILAPFLQSMAFVFLILIPAVTMGLFASEKTNGTQELLLTSPITIWELVLGKFAAAAIFVAVLVVIIAVYPLLLFLYGNPEVGKTLAGLLGVLLLGWGYAAVGAFASSVTRSQLIAFFLALALLLMLLMIGFVAQLSESGGPAWVSSFLKYLATTDHLEQTVMGLIDTSHLAYFATLIAVPLILAKTAVESVRWR